ncbi:MAG TPA: hypothetical protein VJQ86_02115, partial [Rhodanobacteraceae bacterium]|nr:hypothetical protein [Rhodanobacteraceae bacterium]
MFKTGRNASLALGFALLALPAALAHADPPDGSAFLAQVRQATAAYRNINVAAHAGWVGRDPFCVSGPDHGAMGIHVANPALISGNRPKVN